MLKDLAIICHLLHFVILVILAWNYYYRWVKAGKDAEVGKLQINRAPGKRADVTITLADSIVAPITGLNEEVTLKSAVLFAII